MSTSHMRPVSNLTPPVKDWSRQMSDKAARPKWNGAVLREHRKARRWEVDELADHLGATKSLVYKWENNESTPGADWFAALLLVFEVPALQFFTGIDECQKEIRRRAIGARQVVPILIEGNNTNSDFFSTGGTGGTVPRVAAPKPARGSPAAAAKPTSESKHGHRTPKRRA